MLPNSLSTVLRLMACDVLCSLCTTDGELVRHKSDLQMGGYYVAVSFAARFKPLDYVNHSTGRPAFNVSPRVKRKCVLCFL